eukprot:CAMPEP_0172383682 /NCGR_PEP_ID=MMETSP1061-20121228/1531_1 /TAXON_ID=37318 /ORGANISM="Pseudo-nitzschia pungens, Strain cf. pungens" /LENGTH=409 /DNA_ID=CAMNT_0013112009 /DNA_START=159 /DNA_END=1385 /DNA_ORIENTATION=+
MMKIISDNNTNNHLQLNSIDRLHGRRRSSALSTTGAQEVSCAMFDLDSVCTGTNANEGNCNHSNNKTLEEKTNIALEQNRRKTRNFKEIVTNFWMPPTNNVGSSSASSGMRNGTSSPLKNNQNSYNVLRKRSSSDFFGMFHPIELNSSASCKSKCPPNGSANATMNLRANPTQRTNSMGHLFPSIDLLGIDKNLFRPDSDSNDKNSISFTKKSSLSIKNAVSDLLTPNSVASAMVSSGNGRFHNNTSSTSSSIIDCAAAIVKSNAMRNGNHGISDGDGTEVIQPGPYDVVCGRNSGAYNYIGNRRFRVTIEMNLQRYIDSPTREDKTNVIKSIVWMLHNDVGARFLKKEITKTSKHKRSIGKKGTPRFTIMTDKQAREKVGHALRDLVILARKERQKKDRHYQHQEQTW